MQISIALLAGLTVWAVAALTTLKKKRKKTCTGNCAQCRSCAVCKR